MPNSKVSTHKLVDIFLHSPVTLIFLSKQMSLKMNVWVGNKIIIIIKQVKCCLKTRIPAITGSCEINFLKVHTGNMQQKSSLLSVIRNTFSCCAQIIKLLLPPLPPLSLPLDLIFPIYWCIQSNWSHSRTTNRTLTPPLVVSVCLILRIPASLK